MFYFSLSRQFHEMKYRIRDDLSFFCWCLSRRQRRWKPLWAFSHQATRGKGTFSSESEAVSLWKHERFYININHPSSPWGKWMENSLGKVPGKVPGLTWYVLDCLCQLLHTGWSSRQKLRCLGTRAAVPKADSEAPKFYVRHFQIARVSS